MKWSPNACGCGPNAPGERLFEIADLNFGATAERGVLLRCTVCGALYPDRFPTPATLAEAYRDYYTAPVAGRRRPDWLRRLMAVTRGAYLGRSIPLKARRVLDFGCGEGAFLHAARVARPDLDLFGTDLAPPRAAAGFRWLPPDRIEEAGPYDWITLGHVLEHHPSPGALIGRLAAVLAPGGGLWIATPNASSFLIEAAGPWARDVDFPRHREIFARQGLAKLLTTADLETAFLSPPRLNAVLNALATLGNLARDGASGLAPRAVAAWRCLIGLGGHMPAPTRSRDRSSPELVVIGRKPGDEAGREGR